jgi:hypothetical protein
VCATRLPSQENDGKRCFNATKASKIDYRSKLPRSTPITYPNQRKKAAPYLYGTAFSLQSRHTIKRKY